ncbi:HNH endonuclease [Seonamhaeicola sp.]|uniref:HNH endonuclease n=1 Tax=Seonamhaeicola sp. TaxID=1912245 RepID=UPI00260564E3|nr:HNH endonuclease [Seonamhaeicola sp.]
MRCIFCKKDSSNSKSVEHIIPESLGNKKQVLSKGIVCDSCNNYFALKIEKPVLEMPYYASLRGRKAIETKKGKIPGIPGFMKNKNETELKVFPSESNTLKIVVEDKNVWDSIENYDKIYIPLYDKPPKDNLNVSKFIGKIALEALAKRVSSCEGWQNDFVENDGLDELRHFVRYGKGYTLWPYYIRRIYDENQISYDRKSDKTMEIMNEYDFFIPDKPTINGEDNRLDNLYFVMAIMGVEYTINLTNTGLDRYLKWLSNNDNKSILQMEKRNFIQT